MAISPTLRRAIRAMWDVVRAEYPAFLVGPVPPYVSLNVEQLEHELKCAVTDWLFYEMNKSV